MAFVPTAFSEEFMCGAKNQAFHLTKCSKMELVSKFVLGKQLAEFSDEQRCGCVILVMPKELEKESQKMGKSHVVKTWQPNKRKPRKTTQSKRGWRRPLEMRGINLTT